jgi:hypothetical protein
MHARSLPLVSTTALALAGVAAALLVPGRAETVVRVPPALPPEAGLSWDVRDADSGEPIPCKLTLVGVSGTPRPQFTRNDIGRQEGDAIAAHDRIMAASGVGVAHVPLGTYDVYVSRGPEWELAVMRKLVVGPRGAQVVARLHHSVDTPGWISADFHVHAASSTDSRVPMHDRIYEFLSDGVEVITSTDHNVVTDYAPLIQELGVGRSITSIVGDEMTTGSWGHFGAWPLPQQLERAGHGAVLVHGRNAADFFADVRQNAPHAIIDVHHPRIDNEIGYFQLGQLDTEHDRAGRPGFSFDFDALEVLNGYQDSERRSIDRVIDDWFRLLNHGHLITATGNSDTHHLDHNIGGYPRNYVRVIQDAPTMITPRAIADAIRAHRSFLTTAPFVRLRVGSAEIGDVADVRGGKAEVDVEVRAAPWVSVSSVLLYANGREVKRWAVAPSQTVLRLHERFELPLDADGWVVARVDGSEPLAPVVGDRVHFDVRPFALTNPVFLDRDGNGVYDPPLRTAAVPPPERSHPRH